MHRLSRVAALALLATAACDSPRSPVAYGASTSIIVASPQALWTGVEDSVRAALEPRVFTIRDERAFDLTHIDPTSPQWSRLRMWRQIIVIGRADDPWVAPVLDDAGESPPELPALVTGTSIWATGQVVTAVVLPRDGEEQALASVLPEIRDAIQERFRRYVLQRMYASGVDEALARRLAREEGFSLVIPDVYRHETADGVHVFRNDYPDPATLVRSLLVTWRAGTTPDLSDEALLDWRDAVVEAYYARPMVTLRERVEAQQLSGAPAPQVEVHGLWESPPGAFPGGGPFITRVVVCPEQDRTYLLDAWLYAPGKDKYEYLLQLEALLGTFRCGEEAASAAALGGG